MDLEPCTAYYTHLLISFVKTSVPRSIPMPTLLVIGNIATARCASRVSWGSGASNTTGDAVRVKRCRENPTSGRSKRIDVTVNLKRQYTRQGISKMQNRCRPNLCTLCAWYDKSVHLNYVLKNILIHASSATGSGELCACLPNNRSR